MERSQPHPTPLLICPNCKRNIPRIFLKPSKGEMNLKVKCQCSEDSQVHSVREFLKSLNTYEGEKQQCSKHSNIAKKYCSTCSQWLCRRCLKSHTNNGNDHELLSKNNKRECYAHNNPFSYYCQHCEVNCCDDCILNHDNHQCILFDYQEYKELKDSVCEEFKNKNKLLADDLISRFDYWIRKYTKMKEKIQLALAVNDKINEDLKHFHQSLWKTILTFKATPSYEQNKLRTIVIDTNEYISERRDIEVEYKVLKKHLQRNYLLRQSEDEFAATLTGHTESVNCLIQLDDDRLASGSDDSTIKLWNLKSKECTATMTGHQSSVKCLTKLFNCRLVSGSLDSTMKLWNIETKECIATIQESGLIRCLLQLNDGALAFSFNETIKLRNSNINNRVSANLIGHTKQINCLIQLKDKRLASSSDDCTIKLWSIASNEYNTFSIDDNDKPFTWLAQASDERLFFSRKNFNVLILDLKTMRIVDRISIFYCNVFALIQLTQKRNILSSIDGSIRLGEISKNEGVVILANKETQKFNCLIQLNDKRYAFNSGRVNITLYDL